MATQISIKLCESYLNLVEGRETLAKPTAA